LLSIGALQQRQNFGLAACHFCLCGKFHGQIGGACPGGRSKGRFLHRIRAGKFDFYCPASIGQNAAMHPFGYRICTTMGLAPGGEILFF
jgi:hypothetical protein